MPKAKKGKTETLIPKCPKCKQPVFMYEGKKKFCPSCNYYFEHTNMKEEKKRERQLEKKDKKRGRSLFFVALVIIIIVISVSAYYYYNSNTGTNYISIDDVGEIRDLKAKKDIPPQIMSKEELLDYLDKLITDGEKERIERDETIYRSMFIVDDDFDLLNISLESSVDQIAGFYDPDTKEMYVIGNHFSPYVNYILSHEFTHALQDQHFDLNVFIENMSYDQHLARLSVVEGDASLVMNQYVSEMSWEERLFLTLDATMTLGSALSSSTNVEGNKALSSLTMFPYINGLSFVEEAYDDGTWKSVNQLYESPPSSSEQILHYEKYLSKEEPVEINFELPLTGFDLIVSETLGEYFISQMLDLHLGIDIESSLMSLIGMDMTSDSAANAAAGWGGDLFNYYSRDNDFLSVFSTTWDTVGDNDEFNESYSDMLFTIAYDQEGDIFTIRDGYLYKDSSDLNTTIYYSSNNDFIWELIG